MHTDRVLSLLYRRKISLFVNAKVKETVLDLDWKNIATVTNTVPYCGRAISGFGIFEYTLKLLDTVIIVYKHVL